MIDTITRVFATSNVNQQSSTIWLADISNFNHSIGAEQNFGFCFRTIFQKYSFP